MARDDEMGLRQRARVVGCLLHRGDSVASCSRSDEMVRVALWGCHGSGSIPAVAISIEIEALRRGDVGLALVLVALGGDEREVEGAIDGEALAPELQLAARAAEEDAVIDGDAHVAARRGRALVAPRRQWRRARRGRQARRRARRRRVRRRARRGVLRVDHDLRVVDELVVGRRADRRLVGGHFGRLREAEHKGARRLLAARRVGGCAIGQAVKDDVLLQRAVAKGHDLPAVVGVTVRRRAAGAVGLLVLAHPAHPVARSDRVASELDVVVHRVIGNLRVRGGVLVAIEPQEDDGRRQARRRRAWRRRERRPLPTRERETVARFTAGSGLIGGIGFTEGARAAHTVGTLPKEARGGDVRVHTVASRRHLHLDHLAPLRPYPHAHEPTRTGRRGHVRVRRLAPDLRFLCTSRVTPVVLTAIVDPLAAQVAGVQRDLSRVGPAAADQRGIDRVGRQVSRQVHHGGGGSRGWREWRRRRRWREWRRRWRWKAWRRHAALAKVNVIAPVVVIQLHRPSTGLEARCAEARHPIDRVAVADVVARGFCISLSVKSWTVLGMPMDFFIEVRAVGGLTGRIHHGPALHRRRGRRRRGRRRRGRRRRDAVALPDARAAAVAYAQHR
eukprot:scaffold51641_cov63-Phaeocystis_antarctica.AAC.2